MPTHLPRSRNGKAAEDVARICLWEAGREVMSLYRADKQVEFKGRGNVLTEADLASERVILEILGVEYPDMPVLSEETAATTKKDGWTWVADPLDGSHNFSQGIPNFCLNIAMCEEGEPVLGLTFDPLRGEEFIAVKGQGLSVNGRSARTAMTSDLQSSILGVDFGYDDRRAAHMISLLADIWPGVQAVRIAGSAALGLAYAACGRYDLFVHQYLFPWDIAAGIVLVREGGGNIVGRDGDAIALNSEGVVAGAPAVVEDFLRASQGKAWKD